VGRLLITFLLCESKILLRPVLYISHYFKKHRQEYYDRLQGVRDHGQWEAWLKFFLKGIAEVSLEATETARKIVSLREAHQKIITETFGRTAGNGHKILDSLFLRPYVSVTEVSETLGITFAAANNLVQRFMQAGILQEVTGQARYRLFSYQPYILLFSDNRNVQT
jgi:Fic family protein